jgi:hypothetical protein
MLRELRFRGYHSVQEDFSTEPEDQQDDEKYVEGRERVSLNMLLEKNQDISSTGLFVHRDEEVPTLGCIQISQFQVHILGLMKITFSVNETLTVSLQMQEACSMEKEGKEDQKIDMLPFNQPNLKKGDMSENLWNNPNQLSEEMVRSMKDIFLHLSTSSKMSPEEPFANSSSSAEHLSGSTLTTLSDSSVIASVLPSPSMDLNHDDGNFDPYNVNGKEAQIDIGSYSSVAEVSWMYIGNEQLEYASGALRKFRFRVKHLPSAIDYN